MNRSELARERNLRVVERMTIRRPGPVCAAYLLAERRADVLYAERMRERVCDRLKRPRQQDYDVPTR